MLPDIISPVYLERIKASFSKPKIALRRSFALFLQTISFIKKVWHNVKFCLIANKLRYDIRRLEEMISNAAKNYIFVRSITHGYTTIYQGKSNLNCIKFHGSMLRRLLLSLSHICLKTLILNFTHKRTSYNILYEAFVERGRIVLSAQLGFANTMNRMKRSWGTTEQQRHKLSLKTTYHFKWLF